MARLAADDNAKDLKKIKKTKKDCCEKQFWLFYIVKGMRVPGKGMEGGQNKAPELGKTPMDANELPKEKRRERK